MGTGTIDTENLTREEYWNLYGRLITSVDIGAALATTGWIFFWLDQIPHHIIHTHAVTVVVFAAALTAGFRGAWIMIRTMNMLGTKADRRLHILMVSYAIISSGTGILACIIFPAHQV